MRQIPQISRNLKGSEVQSLRDWAKEAEQQIKELKGTIENAVNLSNAGYPLGAIQGLKQELKKWHAEKHYQD